jgi:hypothetical protein
VFLSKSLDRGKVLLLRDEPIDQIKSSFPNHFPLFLVRQLLSLDLELCEPLIVIVLEGLTMRGRFCAQVYSGFCPVGTER